jgi:predicted acetylornithine/succinylornithine family transaminase
MQSLIEKSKKYKMNTYGSFDIVFESGHGCILTDIKGKKYIDFVSGIAVNSLGYADIDLFKALIEQAEKLTHCSNLYLNLKEIALAEKLVENSCFDKVFFCNSGTESVEAAIKLARKYGKTKKNIKNPEIISMKQSFHGRSLGSLSATGQEKYQLSFTPLLEGFKYAEFNNIDSVISLINENTCAVLIEVVQGEGGVQPALAEFVVNLRKLTQNQEILLIIDEVQTGIGRTGKLFAFEHYEIEPDIITLAKGLGGGVPIGAMLAKDFVADTFVPGDHASTFGGNPLACSAALTVLDRVLEKDFLTQINLKSSYLKDKLNSLKQICPEIKELRGLGLMFGLEMNFAVKPIIDKCLEKGLLLIGAGPNVIRFVPPLVIEYDNIDKAIEILKSAILECK